MINKLLGVFSFLAADTVTDATWLTNIKAAIVNVLDSILWPVFGIVAAVGIVYAIVLGVNFAKAETTDKREEAKKRIINACVGVVIMLALIIVLKVFILNLDSVKSWANAWGKEGKAT